MCWLKRVSGGCSKLLCARAPSQIFQEFRNSCLNLTMVESSWKSWIDFSWVKFTYAPDGCQLATWQVASCLAVQQLQNCTFCWLLLFLTKTTSEQNCESVCLAQFLCIGVATSTMGNLVTSAARDTNCLVLLSFWGHFLSFSWGDILNEHCTDMVSCGSWILATHNCSESSACALHASLIFMKLHVITDNSTCCHQARLMRQMMLCSTLRQMIPMQKNGTVCQSLVCSHAMLTEVQHSQQNQRHLAENWDHCWWLIPRPALDSVTDWQTQF